MPTLPQMLTQICRLQKELAETGPVVNLSIYDNEITVEVASDFPKFYKFRSYHKLVKWFKAEIRKHTLTKKEKEKRRKEEESRALKREIAARKHEREMDGYSVHPITGHCRPYNAY